MGSLPDIWCSFGRGMRWLWRSRRNDRQALFLCIFLAEIGNRLSLARSHTRTQSLTRLRVLQCLVLMLVLVLVLMLAGWWPIRRPSTPSTSTSTRPRVTQTFSFFSATSWGYIGTA